MILKQKRTLDYIIGIDVHIKDAYGLKSVLRGNEMADEQKEEREYNIDYRFIVKAKDYYTANRKLEVFLPSDSEDICYTIIKGRRIE